MITDGMLGLVVELHDAARCVLERLAILARVLLPFLRHPPEFVAVVVRLLQLCKEVVFLLLLRLAHAIVGL